MFNFLLILHCEVNFKSIICQSNTFGPLIKNSWGTPNSGWPTTIPLLEESSKSFSTDTLIKMLLPNPSPLKTVVMSSLQNNVKISPQLM